MEDDTLLLWEEDTLTNNQTDEEPWQQQCNSEWEKKHNLAESEFNNLVDILQLLRSNEFPSKMKTVFWRLVCLLIFKVEGKIDLSNFETLVNDILLDFTNNSNIITKLKQRSISVLHTLENKNPLYDQLRCYNVSNDNSKGIRDVTDEQMLYFQSLMFQEIFKYPPPKVESYLQCCDFSLCSKIKLAMLSVISETGYFEFREKVKNEIEKLRRLDRENSQIIYNNFTNCFLDNIEYLTRFTYGTLYNQFYLKDVKAFVDQI